MKRNLEIQRGLIVNRLEAMQSDKPETWKNEYEYPICQEEINQFIEYFIEKSSNDEVAKSAMITFKASISINNHFKSSLQLTG